MEKLNIFEVGETKEGVSTTPAGFSIRVNKFTEKGNVVFLYYPPGTKNELHSHDDIETVYYIVQGEGKVTIGDETEHVKKGEVLFTPLKTKHQVVNAGKETLI
ncbi:cupin domain-containing protein, partial [Candidatus Bathyarchaeota archaeon]|nr:cupin domain-containing protein [Candidatus Bathyarchaeota archaeon]